jgi:ABC-type sugar transport system permease subunit
MIDGASPIQAFFRITVPLMRPVILFCTITSTIGSFGLFAEVNTLTRAGPANATITPLIRIYNTAFSGSFQYGLASAEAYTFFICIFLLTILQYRLNRERE